MVATLHFLLRDSLTSLAGSLDASRTPAYAAHAAPDALPPLDPADLRAAVSAAWDAASSAAAPASRARDVLRSVIDLVGRDIAVRPVIDGSLPEPLEDAPVTEQARFQTALQDRLDIVLTLYEVVAKAHPDVPALEPGAPFIPLLEDFVELLSVSTWHLLFSYMETRAARFCKNMPASRGKALPLLRTINAFLRMLSHTPQDLKLRGRVQLFASSAISVSDKSAINVRGEYAVISTTWEEDARAEPEGDGDIEMSEDKDTQPDFYSTLWSLQQYFAHPPSLDGPAKGDPAQTPFDEFRTKSNFVLSRLFEQTKRERVLRGKNAAAPQKRTRESDDLSYPRYLTARSLLEYEISDQQFRRQILLQYFILFQFLLSLTPATANKQQFTGGMPKSFVIEGENQAWVMSTVQTVREELKRMEPDGPRFEETVVQLMSRERRYAQWKNDGCPEKEWEILPVPPSLASSSAEKWKRQCRPMRRWPYKIGTPGLTRAWETGYRGMSDWRRPEEKNVFELEEELTRIETDEEDDKAMGREPGPEVAEQKRTIRWCALRAARKSHPRVVANLKVYDLHKLVEMIRETESRRAAAAAAGPEIEGDAAAATEAGEGEEGAPDAEGAAEAESEAEAEGEADAEAEAEAPAEAEKNEGEEEVQLAQLPDDDDEEEAARVNGGDEGEGDGEGEGDDEGEGQGDGDGDVPMAEPAEGEVGTDTDAEGAGSAPSVLSADGSAPASAAASVPPSEDASAAASPTRPASEDLGEAE